MLKYSVRHYDERLVLKVPPLLWLSILYRIRHFFLAVVVTRIPIDVFTVPWINLQTSYYFMLTDLPAVLVLFAIGYRVSNGSNFMRRVWMGGRWLLIFSYVAGIAAFTYLNRETMIQPDAWGFLDGMFVVIIDFAFVGYLVRSKLVRDVFNDFPDTSAALKN